MRKSDSRAPQAGLQEEFNLGERYFLAKSLLGSASMFRPFSPPAQWLCSSRASANLRHVHELTTVRAKGHLNPGRRPDPFQLCSFGFADLVALTPHRATWIALSRSCGPHGSPG